MNGTIIVGVDGSKTARKAAESAKDLAVALGLRLLVVSAFDSDRTEVHDSGSDKWYFSAAGDAEGAAKGVADSLRSSELTVTHSVVKGKPADALLQEASRVEAVVIVVGNQRMRGIGRVLGSVANTVAHNALCDVYIANTYDAD